MKSKEIQKTFLKKDLLILGALLLAGCACLPFGIFWRGLGITLIITMLCMYPFYRHGYRIKGHKGKFHIKEIPVSREDAAEIAAFLHGEQKELHVLRQENGGALLSLYYHKNDSEALVQYFDYTNVMQGTQSPVVKISTEQHEQLRKLITT